MLEPEILAALKLPVKDRAVPLALVKVNLVAEVVARLDVPLT